MKGSSVYLRHIADAISRIDNYMPSDKQAFLNDSQCQDAVMRNLAVIGDGNTFALAGKCIGCVDLVLCRLRSRKAISVWASDGVRRPLRTFYPFHAFFMATANKPVKTFRMRGISAAIFANEVQSKTGRRKYTIHKVSLQRSYRDGDTYKNTTVFGRSDLPVLNFLLWRAWEYINDAENLASGEPKDK